MPARIVNPIGIDLRLAIVHIQIGDVVSAEALMRQFSPIITVASQELLLYFIREQSIRTPLLETNTECLKVKRTLLKTLIFKTLALLKLKGFRRPASLDTDSLA